MYKACSKCGKIHDSNYKCNVGKNYQGGNERKLRSLNSWRNKAKEIKTKANYLCEVCKDKGVYTYKNLEAHHIEKLSENNDRLLDNNNLICLCVRCHKEADAGKIKKEYLYKLAAEREARA